VSDDLLARSRSILNRYKNYFSQLLNLHGLNDIRHTEMHTAEPLVPEPRCSEFEIAIEKLKDINHQVLIISGRTDSSKR